MKVEREYSHRTYGAIGSVTLEAEVKGAKLDGKALPESSVTYLLNFALQSLQDAYAGAKTQDEAKAAFAKKLDAIVQGTLGQRSGGGVSEFVRIARSITRGLLKDKYGAKSPEWAKFTGLADDVQDAKLDEIFAKNEATLKPKVEAEIARREAERKAKAKIVAGVELEL